MKRLDRLASVYSIGDALPIREVLRRTRQEADLQAFANIAASSPAVATGKAEVLCGATSGNKNPRFPGIFFL